MSNSGIAPYFREMLRDDLKDWCKENENPKTGEPYDLYRDGLNNFHNHQSKNARVC